MRKSAAVLLLGLVTSLSSCKKPKCYGFSGMLNTTSYDYSHINRYTDAGIAVEDPRHELDLDRVDYITLDVIKCLNEMGPLTDAELTAAQCGRIPFHAEIRSCFVVKVPQDWYVSSCTGNQLFPCNVPDQSCFEKGQTPTKECPCACRAEIQDDTALITAPNLALYSAKVVELMTGCAYPWGTPKLDYCARTR